MKKIALLLLIFVVVTGCGKGSPKTATPKPSPTLSSTVKGEAFELAFYSSQGHQPTVDDCNNAFLDHYAGDGVDHEEFMNGCLGG